jgi:hypothetical protein
MSCEKRLKQILADSASEAGVSFGRFRAEYQLDDFLDNVLLPTDDPLLAAAKALHYFCTEDGRFNGCTFAVKATMRFLEDLTSDSPADDAALEQSQQDLKAVMNANCSVGSLTRWAERWYRL